MSKFLDIEDLVIRYNNVLAVNKANIQVNNKEVVTIIGANGAGKSSILMAISGIVKPKQGKIIFNGENIAGYSPKQIASLGIIQVPEGRHIFPKLTVQENLDLGGYLRTDKKEIKDDLEYVFGIFPILKDRMHQPGGTLSGGEQQMLAIGRALMQNPKILCLDEPSLGLAPILVQRIFQVFDQLRKDKEITILLVEQNVNLALKHSDRAYVLEVGGIVLGEDSKKMQHNDKVKEAYLGGHVK